MKKKGKRGKISARIKELRPTLWEEAKTVPNILTFGRIAAIPVMLVLTMQQTPTLSFISAWIYGLVAITDMLDGWLARKLNQVTILGKYLDPLADKLMVLSLLMAMLVLKRVPLWVVIVLLVREIAITGLRSIASSEGLVIAADKMGKAKTAFQMVGLIALCVHYPYIINFIVWEGELDFNSIGNALLYGSVFFSLYSAGEYFVSFVREMRHVRSSGDKHSNRDITP